MDSEIDKTILEIFAVIQTNDKLETFEIIFQPTETQKTPVHHVEHNLGLESWYVKELYCHVHRKIFARTSGPENQIVLLTTASLLNPCVKTFWNMRKELILKRNLDLYSELHYVAVVLSFKPKVQDLFNHRKWILQEIFKRHSFDLGNFLFVKESMRHPEDRHIMWYETVSIENPVGKLWMHKYERIVNPDLFYNELEVVQNAANRHVNNHMAWDFATWLLDHIESDSKPGQVLQTYWNSTGKWISSHVSDFSAMNFRQQLIKKLARIRSIDLNFKRVIAESCNKYHTSNLGLAVTVLAGNIDLSFVLDLVLSDFELTENLISFYANHEALWTHIRFLCYMVVKVLPEKLSQDEIKAINETTEDYNKDTKRKYQSHPFNVLFRKIHESFLVNVSVNTSNADSFIQKHQKWLRSLGFEG